MKTILLYKIKDLWILEDKRKGGIIAALVLVFPPVATFAFPSLYNPLLVCAGKQ
nr:MAG TPA: hypothetical protein [Caudoviricetes sp.]